jgi:hypothetical protein
MGLVAVPLSELNIKVSKGRKVMDEHFKGQEGHG